ncbi:hypothetical protein DRQ53_10445 [bacterium]|nr:MAG: hypothetical protein DRQ53_10445 [bacterium]
MRTSLLLLVAGLCLLNAPNAYGEVDVSLLAGMQARAIGPAGMSGRIAVVTGVPGDPTTIYVGAATGGVWKSTDGGMKFEPIFDDQPVAAIGAITVDPSNHDVVWVGTGEGNLRNSVSIGNGIYRSRDAGRSWEYLGLPESERIHRIHVHPQDSDTVFVAVTGKLWGDSQERGVYRTRDGGVTWERVLYLDERTGCADLVLDPQNPDKLIAAMYEYRRDPWFYQSGGPGSGIHITVDGGETWTKILPEDGLPEGELGRIGLAIAPGDARRVYAFVEADENGIYRSLDGGWTWSKTSASERFGNRPFYYADLRVDPDYPDRVYSLWSLVSVSDDGGDDWRVLMPWSAAHPDHHAMWIDPTDGRNIINGNDGGVYISRDRGNSWRFVTNLPVGQFYHIAVDDDLPYNVYGGMQDNGSWKGPNEVWENGGIRNYHWRELSFGDGFDTRPMPDDNMRGYSMSQEGYFYRWDLRTGEMRSIRPDTPDSTRLRFNWNAGLAQDPFDDDVIYYGSQFVHRSDDRGMSWERISDDLTTNNPEWQKQDESGGLTLDVTGAENFTTIVMIEPSELQEGVLWVGSDDGRMHVTTDGGVNWTELTGKAKGVPEHTWIPHIGASPHDAGTAFVVFDNHRRSDINPYVHRTTQFGNKWSRLSTDDVEGYALVIEQDPVNADLLYLGTEFGLWISIDSGDSWMRWRHGVPTVSVMDLAVQPTFGDLVLGTHGRAAFVLDDLRPLRGLDEEVLASTLHLFEIPPVWQHTIAQTRAPRFPASTEFRGANRPYGASISFVANGEQLPHPDDEIERARQEEERQNSPEQPDDEEEADAPPTEVTLRILDAEGGLVREFERDVNQGLNRIWWRLESDPFRRPPGDEGDWFSDSGSGPEILPGTYTVVVKFGEEEARGTVEVRPDPRADISVADRQANWDARQRAGAVQEILAAAITRIMAARQDTDTVIGQIHRIQQLAEAGGAEFEEDEDKPYHGLEEEAGEFKTELGELEKFFRTPSGTKGITGGIRAWGELSRAGWYIGSTRDAPSPAVLRHLESAEHLAAAGLDSVNAFFSGPYQDFSSKVLSEDELRLFGEYEELQMPAQ